MERINATTGSYNFIDLFAGAGGLSEGFIQAGFSPVAHVEMNPYAAQTLETRTGYYYLKAQGKLDIYKDYISGKITRFSSWLQRWQITENIINRGIRYCLLKLRIRKPTIFQPPDNDHSSSVLQHTKIL